jgi:PAS domain S-box-containing protein
METELKILLVEDNPGDALLLQELVHDSVYKESQLTVADKLKDAIDYLRDYVFDVILLDLGLPDSNGFETIEDIQKFSNNTPIVILTGLDDERTGIEAINRGVQDYLIKGKFDVNILFKVINFSIERGKNKERLIRYNEVLKVISEVNKLISNERSKEPLLRKCCELLANMNGYHYSWIVLLNDAGNFSSFYSNGKTDGFEELKEDIQNGKYPFCLKHAMEKDEIFIVESNMPDCKACPLSKQNSMFRSFSSPILHKNKLYGVLTVSQDKSQSRLDFEHDLLKEIIQDLSLAIHSFELEETRLKAEQALKESEEKYRLYFNHAPVGYQSLDANGYFIDVNQSWLNILGYKKEEVIGKWFGDFLHPSQRDVFRELFPVNIKRKDLIQDVEFHLLHKDGHTIIVDYIARIGRDQEGNFTRTHCVFQDISERKKFEEELVAAKEHAEESDRLKSAFLANMSHEIRTPMNGILGFADLLKEPDLSGEEKKKYIGIIETSGKRMLNIINDIVNISKIEAGQMEISNTTFSVNEQLDYLYTFFKPEAEKKGIKLIKKIPDDNTDNILTTDKEKLCAILVNLIKNSVKYIHEGVIEFGYVSIAGYLQFYIRDTGIGIPEDKKESVFDRFSRVDNRHNTPYEGAGLGLAITKSYVEMLGGKIWYESEVGTGTQFFFTVPIENKKQTSESGAEKIQSNESDIKFTDFSMLVVEDEEFVRIHLRELLKNRFKSLDFATTGVEAIDFVKENKETDIILMDIRMPAMDGFTAVGKIREFNTDIRIIAQTAYALQGDEQKALDAGCDGYISKPIVKEKLFNEIERVLKIKR